MRVFYGLMALAILLATGLPARAAGDPTGVLTVMVDLSAAAAGAGPRASVEIRPGRILRVQGWRFQPGDEVGAGWSCRFAPEHAGPRSLLITMDAGTGALLRLVTGAWSADFPLDTIRHEGRAEALEGRASAELLPTPQHLSGAEDGDSPAITATKWGQPWAAWPAFDGREDRIGLAERTRERWEYRGYLPRVHGRIHTIALCAPRDDRLLAVWSQERQGAWDLFYAVRSGGLWGKPAAITSTEQADMLPQLAVDAHGTAWLVWQSTEGASSHIRLSAWDGSRWSMPMLITERQANHWAPAVAMGQDGTIYIAWDSYAAGQYDVYVRSLQEGRLTPILRVTDSPEYEANVSLACDTAGRLWIAYDRGEAGWGRGIGAASLHRSRSLGLRCLVKGQLTQPPMPPTEVRGAAAPYAETPRLLADTRGQIWLSYRRTLRDGSWELMAQRFDGRAWSRPQLVPDSAGRSDMPGVLAAGDDGQVWLAWATDRRDTGIIQHTVCAAALPGGFPAPERIDFSPLPLPAPPPTARAARSRLEITFGDEKGAPYLGDLHRHTELAPCHPFQHGSLLDACRYALDASGCDFIALTDPVPTWGTGAASRWRLEQKMASLFSTGTKATVLTGYECTLPGGGTGTVLLSGFADLPAATDAAAPGWWQRGEQEGAIGALHAGSSLPAELPKEPAPALLMLPAPDGGTAAPAPTDASAATPGNPPVWAREGFSSAFACGTGHSTSAQFTYLWASDLAPTSLLVALRLRRTYTGPAGVGVSFTAGRSGIGSTARSIKGVVRLRARIEAALPVCSLELLCDGHPVHAADADGSETAELTFAVTPTDTAQAYLCHAVLADGSEVLTTPIWVEK